MKREDEERAIHPLLLTMIERRDMIERREWLHLNPEQAIVAAEKWFTAGRPWLSDKAKILLENGEARREALAQEIREGLRVRGLWTPTRGSAADLITAIFMAIDKRETVFKAVAAVEKATRHADGMPGRCLTPEAEKAFNVLFEAFLKKE